jgi:hypothetical protein
VGPDQEFELGVGILYILVRNYRPCIKDKYVVSGRSSLIGWLLAFFKGLDNGEPW